MNNKNYQWNIDRLEQIKDTIISLQDIPLEKKEEDIFYLEEMVSIASNYKMIEMQSIRDRFCLVRENYKYMNKLDDVQKRYLQLLEKKVDFPFGKNKKCSGEFFVGDLLDLILEFLEWLPSETAKQILTYYYHNYFDTHFHFCDDKKQLTELGITYSLNCYSKPFVLVKKTTFINTFFTIAHEMGHVLFHVVGIDMGRNKNGEFFDEISGQYFERLATEFLIEKNIMINNVINNEIANYYMFKTNVIQLTPNYLWETFFSYESAQCILGEIYSYLGSLELIERYNYDYEKQLVDFLRLHQNNKSNIVDYLIEAKFNWRQDEFKILEKHKNWLHEMNR